jgi:glutamate-5-semialdehyde dehydrogenase
MTTDLEAMGQRAQAAARVLATTSTDQKNAALRSLAAGLREHTAAIVAANGEDVARAEADGLRASTIQRLVLTEKTIESIAAEVEHVASLPDPVGERFEEQVLPNGLRVHKRRIPLGVVGVIYESRPNVTVDVASLCLKSGNAAILRGGKETVHTNAALAQVIADALARAEIPTGAVEIITDPDRALVLELLRLDKYVSIIIPRGGAALHQFCREHATIPVITGGLGVCHMYVDPTADLDKAVPLIHNAKVQRPSACNSLETLLLHRDIAAALLPRVVEDLSAANVELRLDERAMAAVVDKRSNVVRATPDDFGQEFLALILSVRVVDTLDEALDHIARYSTKNSDAILTTDPDAAARFVDAVDSAAVYVNASTRFTDGSQLGLGAEVAVSTQPLHARGPMGLRELTTYKWVIEGEGQIRE